MICLLGRDFFLKLHGCVGASPEAGIPGSSVAASPEAGIPSNYSMCSPQMSDDDGIFPRRNRARLLLTWRARWINNHKIQAVNGPVWKVSWTDPHFGQVSLSAESFHAESYRASKFRFAADDFFE